jgi:hypothetical protein
MINLAVVLSASTFLVILHAIRCYFERESNKEHIELLREVRRGQTDEFLLKNSREIMFDFDNETRNQ